jgi:hypothetical protein
VAEREAELQLISSRGHQGLATTAWAEMRRRDEGSSGVAAAAAEAGMGRSQGASGCTAGERLQGRCRRRGDSACSSSGKTLAWAGCLCGSRADAGATSALDNGLASAAEALVNLQVQSGISLVSAPAANLQTGEVKLPGVCVETTHARVIWAYALSREQVRRRACQEERCHNSF